jgi:hypothetical protein
VSEVIEIKTIASEAVEVITQGPQGPVGPKGDPGDVAGLPLTTTGDTLYRAANNTNARLPIGAAGQILKVAASGIPEWGAAPASGVSSVNGETGAVSLSAVDVGAAAATHTHDGTEVFLTDDEAYGPVLAQSFAEGRNGIYWPTDLTLNGKPVYKLNRTFGIFFQSLRWHIFENSPLTANIVSSSADDDESFPHQTTWSGGNVQRANVANFGTLASQQFQFVGDVLRVGTSSGLPLKTGSGGAVEASAFGTGAGQFAEGNHTHGNLTNAGAIGTTANLPLKTGTNGVIEAGSFSNTAGSFCAGDDVRLSDDRDPNLHAASHLPDGADEIFDQDLNTTATPTFVGLNTGNGGLTFGGGDLTLNASTGVWELAGFGASIDFENGALINFSIDAANVAGLGTAATEDATAFAASGSITTSGLTQATARILGRTTASTGSIEEIQIGSGLSLSAGELSATGSGGISAVGTTLADILSVSGSDLVADDLAADKLYGWDDSESKAIGFIIGSGLSVSGDTLSATASGGSKTYAVFVAGLENSPPSTAFATLDTRSSIPCLDFDDATDESAVFMGIIPEGASLGSGLKIRLHWMATTATSGNVVWDVSLERMTTGLDSDSFDTIASGTAAANGTSGILTVTEITLTTIDSVTAGDGYRLKVTRDANNASDTMTGDAELVVCEVRSAA